MLRVYICARVCERAHVSLQLQGDKNTIHEYHQRMHVYTCICGKNARHAFLPAACGT